MDLIQKIKIFDEILYTNIEASEDRFTVHFGDQKSQAVKSGNTLTLEIPFIISREDANYRIKQIHLSKDNHSLLLEICNKSNKNTTQTNNFDSVFSQFNSVFKQFDKDNPFTTNIFKDL
jgi:hypothetical protein